MTATMGLAAAHCATSTCTHPLCVWHQEPVYGPERFGRTSEAIITRVVELTDMRGGDVVVDVGSGVISESIAFS